MLPEDGTYVPKHLGAALVINTLTKPSAQCWFSMHNPAMRGTNIKLPLDTFTRNILYRILLCNLPTKYVVYKQ
jgi:hypothetical protein